MSFCVCKTKIKNLLSQVSVVKVLINRGASINSKTGSGLTPLLLATACLTERYPVFDALLTAGAKCDCRSPQGKVNRIRWLVLFLKERRR